MKMKNDELYHFGIKGMKWGVRRWQNSDGTFNDAGKERYFGRLKKSKTFQRVRNNPLVDKQINAAKNKWDGLTDEQKKLIKIGAVVAVTTLAAYGAYRVYRSNNAISFIPPNKSDVRDYLVKEAINNNIALKIMNGIDSDCAREVVNEAFSSYEDSYKDDATLKIYDPDSIPMWDTNENTIENVSQIINPDFISAIKENGNGKPFNKMSLIEKVKTLMKVPSGATTNCMYCTTAFDLNRRGYKVAANHRLSGGNLEQLLDMYDFYNDDAIMNYNSTYGNVNKFLKRFSDYDNGARGNMIVSWKTGGGHSMAWEVVNGNLQIIDNQIGVIYSKPSEIKKLISTVKGDIQMVRLDDADVVWSDMMLRSLDYVNDERNELE